MGEPIKTKKPIDYDDAVRTSEVACSESYGLLLQADDAWMGALGRSAQAGAPNPEDDPAFRRAQEAARRGLAVALYAIKAEDRVPVDLSTLQSDTRAVLLRREIVSWMEDYNAELPTWSDLLDRLVLRFSLSTVDAARWFDGVYRDPTSGIEVRMKPDPREPDRDRYYRMAVDDGFLGAAYIGDMVRRYLTQKEIEGNE